MIERILNSQIKSISTASLILGTCYFLSALMGLFRDRLLAGTFGVGNELDVYYSAFTIPDLIGLIFIFGGISSAVIPIFSSYLLKSEKEAWQYLSNFLNVFFGLLIIICFISIFFTDHFISIATPGFSPTKRAITARLMRIMFLSPIILGLSNVISAVLQVFKRFIVTAIAPLLYNMGIIIGILFFYPLFGLSGLAWGVVLGAFLHLAIQFPVFLFSGFRYNFYFDFRHPGMIKTIKLMLPRSIGLAANQVNTMIIVALASMLSGGSIAVFNLANNLSSLLVNVFAVSLSVAIFPSISMLFLQAEEDKLSEKFSYIFRQLLFVIIPMSILIIILRAQIVRVILGAGKFGWLDTRLTAATLGILAFGLLAQSLIPLLSRIFYAFQDTLTPALISIFSVALNLILSISLIGLINFYPHFTLFLKILLRLENIKDIGIIGLAISFLLTTIFQAFSLAFLLYKRFPYLKIKGFSEFLLKSLIASILMGLTTFGIKMILGTIFNLSTFWEVFLQLFASGIGGITVFILVSYLLKCPELKIFFDIFLKRFFYPFK